MKKVLAITGGTALLTGAGVWALGGWSVVGLSLLVPLFVVTMISLTSLGIGYGLVKLAPKFAKSFGEGINDLATGMAA